MTEDHNWRRRHAIQIVAQLPEGTEDALAVLELAKELVEGFLQGHQARAPLAAPAEVLPFPASVSSR
jgi:hypothetical protein